MVIREQQAAGIVIANDNQTAHRRSEGVHGSMINLVIVQSSLVWIAI